MYKVFKKSITVYTVIDSKNEIIYEGSNLTLIDCKFKVNLGDYNKAKKLNFKNSGEPLDFFAYIECKEFQIGEMGANTAFWNVSNRVFFNPFKSSSFLDRKSLEAVKNAKICIVTSNIIHYV